jgi:hypothetical protein
MRSVWDQEKLIPLKRDNINPITVSRKQASPQSDRTCQNCFNVIILFD